MFYIRNFTGQNFVGLPSWSRAQLTGSITYYVRTDGSDLNTGRGNTAGAAFKSIQRGVDTILTTLDTNGYVCNIQVADGTYTGSIVITNPTVGGGQISIVGNNVTPTNVNISTPTGSNGIWVSGCPSSVFLSGFKISSPGPASAIISGQGSFVYFTNLNFGLSGTHLYSYDGGFIQATGNYNISGPASQHYNCQYRSIIQVSSNLSINITNTPAFSPFCYVGDQSCINCYSTSYTGSATGQRFVVDRLSGVLTRASDGNVNYFPGNIAGSTLNGSQYL